MLSEEQRAERKAEWHKYYEWAYKEYQKPMGSRYKNLQSAYPYMSDKQIEDMLKIKYEEFKNVQ